MGPPLTVSARFRPCVAGSPVTTVSALTHSPDGWARGTRHAPGSRNSRGAVRHPHVTGLGHRPRPASAVSLSLTHRVSMLTDLTPSPHVYYHGTCHRAPGPLPGGRGVVMLRLRSRRPKRAAQAHVPHSRVDVHRLIRVTQTQWSAHVTYTHGLSEWTERVNFVVLAERPAESMLTIIVITDGDYPQDRERRIQVAEPVDMPQFVRDYLIAGRW